ncbi:MAG: hypothetical protein HN405_02940 [Planctomycetes bacterium]|jgi:tetratricopeptide (TPR) repeat protein|nr:hypothetical protein [Planctomycetota bacterium]MBT4028691.1 hypothetical protein [Planctomycetota bacterium]MBT4560095.1 hypothetical protein [Planctomycetota bacterium]MBT5102257.1 hypothetical protein [Planctomycetota bacterium]MBT7319131.1 hypothetical protein [Planctomycetota bacterium]
MYDRTGFVDAMRNVQTAPRVLCQAFQRDLSALLDGELAEDPARRTLVHIESCVDCAEFFEAIRLQALAHRDAAIPGSLSTRLRRMRGQDLFDGLTDAEILRRLAQALYELGKAYALVATDGDYLLRVAQEPVVIDEFTQGEAADAAHAAEESGAARLSAETLRHDASNQLVKSHQLLGEALRLKPKFAEARIYLGFVLQSQGNDSEAIDAYREVFLRTDRLVNRGHAAVQLGLVYDRLGESQRALRIYRWVVASGLVARKPEFSFVLHNIVVEHLALDDAPAASKMLLHIRNHYPSLWSQAIEWLRSAPELLATLGADQDSSAWIRKAEPALFAA